MLKQITLHGQRIELHYSPETRTWCSKVADVITMRKRKQKLEKHIKTIAGHIYLSQVNDKFGADSEDYHYVHFGRGRV